MNGVAFGAIMLVLIPTYVAAEPVAPMIEAVEIRGEHHVPESEIRDVICFAT